MEPDARLQWARRLAVIVVAWTFVLMGLGAWVKATGSGLACPDWPQCYGQWLPPFPSVENQGVDLEGDPVFYTQDQILYEWAHRAVASALGVPFLLLVVVCAARRFHPAMRALPLAGALVLAIQVGIGGGTVLKGNPDWLTTIHLLTATLFFFLVTCAMLVAYLRPFPVEAPQSAAATPVRQPGPQGTEPVPPAPGPFPGEVWYGGR